MEFSKLCIFYGFHLNIIKTDEFDIRRVLNSLSSERLGGNFYCVNLQPIIIIAFLSISNEIALKGMPLDLIIGSGNILVPSGKTSLLVPMLTHLYLNLVSLGASEFMPTSHFLSLAYKITYHGQCFPKKLTIMMASSNWNIFRVAGPLCGEFTSHRSIPLTKASDAGLWYYLSYVSEQTVEQKSRRWLVETPSRPLWRYCNETTFRDGDGCWLLFIWPLRWCQGALFHLPLVQKPKQTNNTETINPRVDYLHKGLVFAKGVMS